jgi:hypothetical protein
VKERVRGGASPLRGVVGCVFCGLRLSEVVQLSLHRSGVEVRYCCQWYFRTFGKRKSWIGRGEVSSVEKFGICK